jgi:hypothetical protein
VVIVDSQIAPLLTGYRKVDGGYEYWSKLENRMIFERDIERVVDKGGKLSLSNKNISNFSQISQWYTDLELSTITSLIIPNNKLRSFEGIEAFPNLEELDISFNLFDNPDLLQKTELASIDVVILKGNPFEQKISSEKIILSKNFVINSPPPCAECKCNRSPAMVENYGVLCKNCHASKKLKEAVEGISLYPQPSFIEQLFKSLGKLLEALGIKGTLIAIVIIYFLYVTKCG